jgi:hypothetical protein
MNAQPRLDLGAPGSNRTAAANFILDPSSTGIPKDVVILAWSDLAPKTGKYSTHHMYGPPPPERVARIIMDRLTCPAADLRVQTRREPGNIGVYHPQYGLLAALAGISADALRSALAKL